MLELKKGKDILTDIGGVKTENDVENIFRESMDDINFSKIERIISPEARLKIANAIAVCQPDSVFVNTGSPADRKYVADLSVAKQRGKKTGH